MPWRGDFRIVRRVRVPGLHSAWMSGAGALEASDTSWPGPGGRRRRWRGRSGAIASRW